MNSRLFVPGPRRPRSRFAAGCDRLLKRRTRSPLVVHRLRGALGAAKDTGIHHSVWAGWPAASTSDSDVKWAMEQHHLTPPTRTKGRRVDPATPIGVQPLGSTARAAQVLVFSDEFTGTSLDTSKWTARDQERTESSRTDGVRGWCGASTPRFATCPAPPDPAPVSPASLLHGPSSWVSRQKPGLEVGIRAHARVKFPSVHVDPPQARTHSPTHLCDQPGKHSVTAHPSVHRPVDLVTAR